MSKVSPRVVPDKVSFYMGLALIMASRSKDPNTQIGAVIVNEHNMPLGWGYNGTPRNIEDSLINWARPEKYDYIIHAEENAIIHSGERSLANCTIYVTAKPCKKCLLKLVAYNFEKVIYLDNKGDANSSLNNEDFKVLDEIVRLGKIKIERFSGNINWLFDRVKQIEMIFH